MMHNWWRMAGLLRPAAHAACCLLYNGVIWLILNITFEGRANGWVHTACEVVYSYAECRA